MEHKREADVEDYWLIQYQRLLEKKPNSLLEKVHISSVFIVMHGWNSCCVPSNQRFSLRTQYAFHPNSNVTVLFWKYLLKQKHKIVLRISLVIASHGKC